MILQESQDVATRGMAFYQSHLRSILEPHHREEYVAIEPDSGNYFLGRTLSDAIQSARRAHPGCLVFAHRIGHPSAVEFQNVQ